MFAETIKTLEEVFEEVTEVIHAVDRILDRLTDELSDRIVGRIFAPKGENIYLENVRVTLKGTHYPHLIIPIKGHNTDKLRSRGFIGQIFSGRYVETDPSAPTVSGRGYVPIESLKKLQGLKHKAWKVA